MPLAAFNIKTEGAYLCNKCGNWYTKVPNSDPDDYCNTKHSERACCHYNEKASLPPEITTAKACALAQTARDLAFAGHRASAGEQLAAALGAATGIVNLITTKQAVDTKNGQMHPYINAEAFVLPGREDGVWYDLVGLREAVQMGRRPPTDVVQMERVVRVTRGQADLTVSLIEETRALLLFAAPIPVAEVAPTPKVDPFARQGQPKQPRAAKTAKRNAAKAAKTPTDLAAAPA